MGNLIIIKGADFSATAVERVVLQGTVAISVLPSYDMCGTVTGTGMYNEGDTIQITAVPKTGFIFSRWDDGNTQAIRNIEVGAISRTYTAIFEADPSVDIPLDLGEPIVGEYYKRGTAEITKRGEFNRYKVIDVSIFAGRTLEINAVINTSTGAAACLIGKDNGDLNNITITGQAVWESSSHALTGGPYSGTLPSNAQSLYLCYNNTWHQGDVVFPGVTAVIKAEV